MRSAAFTFLLIFIALLFCGLAGWTLTQGNLDVLLGTPATAPGQKLYGGFTPDDVHRMRITGPGGTTNFIRTERGWEATHPWADRMNPRAAFDIIQFTLNLRVEDVAEVDRIDRQQTGLDESAISIHLEDESGKRLARYDLGKNTPWFVESTDGEPPVPTVFIETRDKHRKDHVYICAGDIHAYFADHFRHLRDHRPFYFNPLALEKIRIRTEQGELTLGRETPQSPWRIVKPLDLATDPDAMKNLLEGLVLLQATRVINRAEVTVSSEVTSRPKQIAIASFGSEEETVLEIQPSETSDGVTVRATVSDRPGTVFELPSRPVTGMISLANLPLAVNELRDAKLTHLNVSSLTAISIQPSTGAEILISRQPPQPWMATIEGHTQPANERRLFELLKTTTEGRVIGFETDAASDLSAWGLDRPFLKLRFLGQDNQAIELLFGFDGQGGVFTHRTGTTSVMRVDPSLLSGISIRPHEWRHAKLWSLDRINLVAIDRTLAGSPALELRYQFLDETWHATQAGEDRSAEIDPQRANFMLGNLEKLQVARWLSIDDAQAAGALQSPLFTFAVTEKRVDDVGDFAGLQQRELKLAPSSAEANPPFFYGKLSNEPNYFLLDRDTVSKIVLPLDDP